MKIFCKMKSSNANRRTQELEMLSNTMEKIYKSNLYRK